MNDLISRAAAVAQIKENYCDWCDHTDLCKSCETYDCIATIEQHVPAVDAAPVVHGRWIKYKSDMHGTEPLACSVCDYLFARLYPQNYCPNCGAKMDDEQHLAFADQSGAEYADNPTV